MIIWLASYPKSGNTWLRSIICSILYSENGLFQFELLEKIKQFPSQDAFKDFTSEFNNINEIKKLWILAQEKINLNNEINFLKTHHINCKIENYSFTNKSNTLATIYIVRDPRNLVNSISNHFSKSIEDSKNFLFEKKMLGTKEISFDDNDIYTLLGSWSDHYNYWTSKTENLLVSAQMWSYGAAPTINLHSFSRRIEWNGSRSCSSSICRLYKDLIRTW